MENGHVKRKQEERQSHDYGLKFGKGVNEINLGKDVMVYIATNNRFLHFHVL